MTTAYLRTASASLRARLHFAGFSANADGAAAVEFALISTLFLMMIAGIVQFSLAFNALSGVQQLTAEAARAAVAGLSASERDSIARGFVSERAAGYGYLETARMTVSTSETTGADKLFTISIDYNFNNALIGGFARFVPMPPPVLRRASSIRIGGV